MSGSGGGSWANKAGKKRDEGNSNASSRGRPRGRVTYPVNVNLGGTSEQGAQPAVQDRGDVAVARNPKPQSTLPSTSVWGKPTAVPHSEMSQSPRVDFAETPKPQSTLPSTSVWGKSTAVPPSEMSQLRRVDIAETPKPLETAKLPPAKVWGKPMAVPEASVPQPQRVNITEIPKSQVTPPASVWGKPPVVASTAVSQPSTAVSKPSTPETIKPVWGRTSSASVTTPNEGQTLVKVKEQAGSQHESLQPSSNAWVDRVKMSGLNIGAPSFCPQTSLPAGNNTKLEDAKVYTSASEEASTPRKEEQLTVVKQVNPKLHMLGLAVDDPNRVRPMRRKEAGCSGKVISVVANHFKVSLKNIPSKVYHYDVVITPKELKSRGQQKEEAETTVPDRLLPVVWKLFEERFHTKLGARMPFDGKKNCYTAKPLRLGMSVWSDEMTMVDPDDGDKTRTFRIQLKLANEVHTDTVWTYLKSCDTWDRCELPQEVIQALDVALRYRPMNTYTPCNRSFFSSEKPYAISDLLELWYGHNQSLLLGRDGNATLNIDMANKAFVKKMSVVKLLKIILNKDERSMELSSWTDRQFRDAENFIKGKLVEYGSGGQHPDGSFKKLHRFVAVKIVNTDPDTFKFPLNEKQISIREHFLDKQVTIKHPKWPVVHIGNKNMTNYVPLELCEILPQAYKGKLEAEDTSRMIRGAATEPIDRFNRIAKSRAGSKFEECPALKEFGMEVEKQMVQINSARKLLPPQIMFKNDRGVVQSQAPPRDDGKFVIGQFLQGAKIAKIGILNASGKNAPDFLRKITDFARLLGREADLRGFQSISAGSSQVANAFAEAHLLSVKARTVRGSTTYNVSVQEGLKDL
ncbi:unnamed protein product [Orchesella dallaii]|uniref:PAZ domain-containing protein n=1 Tax=Orchesella dallaii TaxID=48710 RepID=A0ABP1S6X2_9HEXA